MTKTIIGREFPKKVTPLIKAAKNTIDIIVYDWRWYPNEIGSEIQLFNYEIVRAIQRGVKVKVLLNNNIIEATLKKAGAEIKQLKSEKTVHSKMMIIDDALAILGSHNYTKNAFELNHETSIIIDDIEAVENFKKYFTDLFR
ncbi:MAG: phospholipase D-like domain-containing protein [Clostridia bacterium]|jgi:phosphatidylserine/phosphatidylglycerophosphate/cardiolipin synthase-like enzyme